LGIILAYIQFGARNYLRQHRYIREIIVVGLFTIFFWAYLSDDKPDESIWLVFCVFAILLNLITAPSIFYMEKGNTLYFLIGKPYGRRNFFVSRIILIVLIDLFWILFFSSLYALRFLSIEFLFHLPLRLSLVGAILILTTVLISLSYTYKPQLSWLIFLLIILGSIVNKGSILPVQSLSEAYKLLIFLLPPVLELNLFTVSLSFVEIKQIFLIVAVIQTILLFLISYRGMMRKDLL
jgi:hypothetical protein